MKDTKRLTFRKWQESDIGAVLAGLSENGKANGVARNIGIVGNFTEEHAKSYMAEAFLRSAITYAIALKNDDGTEGEVIGGTDIYWDAENKIKNSSNLWINHDAKYQNRGYGAEAYIEQVRYCFDELGATEMYERHLASNSVSERMQKKLGYKPVAKEIKFFGVEDVDVIISHLTKEDFHAALEKRKHLIERLQGKKNKIEDAGV